MLARVVADCTASRRLFMLRIKKSSLIRFVAPPFQNANSSLVCILVFFSRYISRYVNLKLGFLPFVVASIVAMVFFSAVFAARAPAMGNSADRAWQLSQLVEGVLTACNPSHGSLSCVETNCGVVRVAGYSVVWDLSFPPPLFPLKSTKRSAAAISRSQRSFITFYGALRNILLSAGFPVTIHMIALEQTFVNGAFE